MERRTTNTTPHTPPHCSLPLLHSLLIQNVPSGLQQDGQGQSQAPASFIPPPAASPPQLTGEGGRQDGSKGATLERQVVSPTLRPVSLTTPREEVLSHISERKRLKLGVGGGGWSSSLPTAGGCP